MKAKSSSQAAKTKVAKKKTVRRKSRAAVIDLVPSVFKLKKILVPLDFSDHSTKALKYAIKFAQQFGAHIDLLHVVEPAVYPEGMIIPPDMEDINTSLEKQAVKTLKKTASQTIPKGVAWSIAVRVGSPYSEIVELARKTETDLLIITTHGYTGLKHFVMGSTAERIVRHAPCPVLTVRDTEHEFV